MNIPLVIAAIGLILYWFFSTSPKYGQPWVAETGRLLFAIGFAIFLWRL